MAIRKRRVKTEKVAKEIQSNNKTRKATKKPSGTMYKIHDNGGTPFHVYVSPGSVDVRSVSYDDKDEAIEGDTVFQSKAQNVFIGEDKSKFGWQPMTKGNKGNSILIQTAADTFVWIGWKVQKFELLKGDSVESFESMIGNNDVPYPFVRGKLYTYLMLEEKAVPNELLDMSADPYKQYYTDKSIESGSKKLKMKTLVKRQF